MTTPTSPAATPPAAAGGPLVITVHGTPAPQGSKKHVGNGVMVESSKKVKPWREAVKWAAIDVMDRLDGLPGLGIPNHARLTGPVCVYIVFRLPRPHSHYRTGRNAHELREGAPHYVSKRPDIDKLLRSTLDALGEAGCWADDAQVAIVTTSKVYASKVPPGATITVRAVHP